MTNLSFDRMESVEIITLNRPEVLNALNIEMVESLADHLEILQKSTEIQAIFIKGAGEKAFCAGGDIKAARLGAIEARQGRGNLNNVIDFFAREYALNKKMFHFTIPTISFMNGITMGGGVGVAGACKYRIATEKTVWAMPEVTIGFFPDVGAAYYLSRAPHNVGKYLALTGGHISNPADLIKCGFATHFMSLNQELLFVGKLAENQINAAIIEYSSDPGECILPYNQIENCFSSNNVEAILDRLEEDDSDWALETARVIRMKSPSSLKVTLRHLELAANEGFDDIIARDLHLAEKFLRGDDLIEGIRAAVVDKDKSPKWNPDSLQAVGKEQVDDYFNQNLGLVG